MLLYADTRFTSPYAMSAFVALTEKGLSFEIRTINLEDKENTSPAYAACSLTQRVPALVDGDFTLSESSAIAEYLEDIHPDPPIFPRPLKARARARQVQAWLRSDFLPLRRERSMPMVYYRLAAPALSEAAQVAAGKLCRVAQELLDHGGDHLFDAWSIADVDLAAMLNRLVLCGDDVPARLVRYAAAQ